MKKSVAYSPTRTKYAFIAGVVVLLILSIFSFERVQQQKSSSEWVEKAYFVKLKLKEAFADLRDAEAAQGAFLLTRDSSQLGRFVGSISTIPVVISQLDSVIQQTDQQKDLQLFAYLLQNRIKLLDAFLDKADSLTGEQLYQFLMDSRITTDRTRALISIMEKREDTLLASRLRDKERQETLSSIFILLFSVTSLTILLLSFFRLRKESSLRNESETNAAWLEEQVAKRTTVIRKINEELNRKNEELERKNEELSSFTYIASHDLKEPIRKISVFTDRISQSDGEQLSPNGKKFLERTKAAIQHMQRLIDSVFSYSRTEQQLIFEQVKLDEVATHAIDLLQEQIDEKAAIIDVDPLPEIFAIRDQMEQLFINLINNSLKYSQPGITPKVEIRAIPSEQAHNGGKVSSGWSLIFKDNGIGFDEQYKEKIFQIFQRLHGRDEYGGTGIGLAICKKIVENHKGYIDAHSLPQNGAVFTVFIPNEAEIKQASSAKKIDPTSEVVESTST